MDNKSESRGSPSTTYKWGLCLPDERGIWMVHAWYKTQHAAMRAAPSGIFSLARIYTYAVKPADWKQ